MRLSPATLCCRSPRRRCRSPRAHGSSPFPQAHDFILGRAREGVRSCVPTIVAVLPLRVREAAPSGRLLRGPPPGRRGCPAAAPILAPPSSTSRMLTVAVDEDESAIRGGRNKGRACARRPEWAMPTSSCGPMTHVRAWLLEEGEVQDKGTDRRFRRIHCDAALERLEARAQR